MLGLLFEFGDEAGADAIETGDETAPGVALAPEIGAGLRIDDGEISIARGRSFVVIGDRVFGDVATIIDGAGLSAGEKDVAAFVRVGGEKEEEARLFGVADELELPPFLELREGMVADRVGAGLVEEVDGWR